MDTLEPKKLALLRIKEILEAQTDEDHPLKQEEIVGILEKDYKLKVDRRAVSRNLSLLKEAGVEIETVRGGSYLASRLFEDAELHMLIDSVLCSRHITEIHSKELIKRLCSMSNRYFSSHAKYIHTTSARNKTENNMLFYVIAAVDHAIETRKQLAFDFNRYGLDKKLHKTAEHTVSPYGMVLHNQRYYLIARNERWQDITYYRMDHITNIRELDTPLTPIRKVKGYENGIDYKRISSSMPYLFNDTPVPIRFRADAGIIDEIIEWFGRDVRITPADDKTVEVSLTASPMAMEYWSMQFLNAVEVLSPSELREQIKENIAKAAQKYQ